MNYLEMSTSDDTEQKIEIEELIQTLNDKHKAIVALIMAGYTQKQSGQILGVTRVAVGLAYKKALGKLRNSMGANSEIS